MKIAVSSLGENLESPFDNNLNHASHILILDSKYLCCDELQILKNGGTKHTDQEFARSLKNNGVNVVVTGNCNEKTSDCLSEANISLYNGQKGSVKDNLLAYYRKQLIQAVSNHYTIDEPQNVQFTNPADEDLWEIIPGFVPTAENEV